MVKKNLCTLFFSDFTFHVSSKRENLYFRAKLFASIIAAKRNVAEEEFSLVENIGYSIYKDENLARLLSQITKEIIQKGHIQQIHSKLIKDIINQARFRKKYRKKIEVKQCALFKRYFYHCNDKIYFQSLLQLFKNISLGKV